MNCAFYILIILYFIGLTAAQENQTCGRPLGNQFRLKMDRIVAGYDVGYYRYPWYASLIVKNESVCGGVLVAPQTILTAASCYKNYLASFSTTFRKLENVYNVTLGMYNNCIPENQRTYYQVEKVNIHELYYTKKPFYDIALLTIIGSTQKYTPICLPSADAKKPLEGTVMGMGALNINGSIPCTLHEARLLIYPQSKCSKIIEDSGNNANSMVNTFCAGYTTTNADTCQGDAGSPLQIMADSGEYILLGLVSFGFHCANPNVPGMYTDITKYLEWINEKSGLNIHDALKPLNIPVNRPTEFYGKPFRRIIKIIVIRNGHFIIIRKPVLHYPIISDYYKRRKHHKND